MKNGTTVSAKEKAKVTRQEQPCDISGCWQIAKCRGLCPACYQGMRRLLKLGLAYIGTYQNRVKRFNTRALAASSELRATLPVSKKRKAA